MQKTKGQYATRRREEREKEQKKEEESGKKEGVGGFSWGMANDTVPDKEVAAECAVHSAGTWKAGWILGSRRWNETNTRRD